jgi:small redox-active disulfide protein 2
VKIEVIGSGCPKCKQLYEITQKVATEMGIKEKVEYVSGQDGIQRLVKMGVMSSPALAVNGKIVMTGLIPDASKIKATIMKATKK